MDESKSQTPNDDELVAYLDGELPSEYADKVERRLAQDPEARVRLQHLERTWDALDILPISGPTNSFTKSTMELVVSSIKHEQTNRKRSRNRIVLAALWCLLAVVSMIASYVLTTFWRDREYRAIVTDLPVLQNFVIYRTLQNNLDYLEKLNEAEIFVNDNLTSPYTTTPKPTFEENKTLMEAMSPEQLKTLEHRKLQFDLLNTQEKESYRTFHTMLLQQPDSRQLMAVGESYYSWQSELDIGEKIELQNLATPQEKILFITKLRELQSSEVDRLPKSDFISFDRWLKALAEKYGEEVKSQLAGRIRQSSKEAVLANNETAVRIYLRFSNSRELVPSAEYQLLKTTLSTAAKRIMESGNDSELNFVRQMLARPQITDAELQSFFFTLPSEERNKLDGLSPELFKDEVRALYLSRKLLLPRQSR